MDKLPAWAMPLLRFGATALIAFYLVYSNNELMKNTVIRMNDNLIKHEQTTHDLIRVISGLQINYDRNEAHQIKILGTICTNGADDHVKRDKCDEAKEGR